MRSNSNASERYLPHQAGATLHHLIGVYLVQPVHPASVRQSVPVSLGQHIYIKVRSIRHAQVM